MARIVFTLAEWRSVARELRSPHHSVAPPGLHERIHALVQQAPQVWPDQPFALELDESSIEAVWAVHAALFRRSPHARERESGISQASRIIQRHQYTSNDPPVHDKELP